jgi:hypothetical protein
MSTGLPDYYAILHVDPAAPAEVIRASYRTLMQQLRAHPDLGGDHEAAARLNAAYAVLKDATRRAQYDAERSVGPHSANAGTGAQAKAGGAGHSEEPATRPRRHTHTGNWQKHSGAIDRTDVCPFCGTAASVRGVGTDLAEACRNCTAPLTILRPVTHDSVDAQRTVYRIAKTETVRVFISPDDKRGIEARLLDVSLSGMRFTCGYELAKDDVVRVDCDICDAVARVAHLGNAAGQPQYGAQFLTARFKRQRGSLLSVPA